MNLLYKSHFFATYQSDQKRCFFLDLGQKQIKLSCCQLLALRTKLTSINLNAHFDNSNAHGIEIISLCNREHILILDTLEVLDLLELIKGTFTFLELHSLLKI